MKNLTTQEITPKISHAIFVSDLMRVCADQINASLKYADSIDHFGRVMCPFQGDLTLCAALNRDSITLMATIQHDHIPVMLKLSQAEFEIGEPKEIHYIYEKRKSWKAPVKGQSVEFFLYFYTDVDTAEEF